VASEEIDVQQKGVDRFSLDDFRLRLDSPLFHRDPGVTTGQVERQLPWERTPVAEPAPTAAPQPTPDDGLGDFRAQLVQASALPAMPRLPTFAEMIAASGTAPVVEPVSEEPPFPAAEPAELTEAALTVVKGTPDVPAGRPEDPLVNDLAERILLATNGLIAAATQAAAAPAAAPEPTPPAVAPVASSIEAELNRLAYLPEREDSPERVVVPAIAVSDPVPTPVPAIPNLSQHEMYLPRVPVQPPVRRSYADFAASIAAPRRRKRHPLRTLFATVVLLGLLGGGLFAAKYYFFDQRWSADVKPLVVEVEQARGLSFDHAVKVTTLSGDDYAVRLVNSTFGIDAANQATIAGGWRALGLLSGGLDPRGLGLAAIADNPAFYDPSSETIYVVAALPVELHRFAVERALTLALLDQEYGWSGRVSGKPESVVRGTRALYDADALAVATSLLTDTERSTLLTEQSTLYTAFPVGASAAPFVTTMATRPGLALRAYFDGAPAAARETVERDAVVSDGDVLDMRRLLAGQVTTPSAASQGMLFWYHALAARVGNDTAWRAVLGWRDDSVSFVQGERTCVSALVQVDTASYDVAFSAFQAWASGAPGESGTTVSGSGAATAQITISACDPGDTIATNDGRARLTLGGAPLRSEQFHRLAVAFPQLSPVQLACAVFAGDAVSTGDERGLVDPVGGWAAPAAHPAPDPNQAGCTA
jgi:hypothetical protein